MKVKELKQFLKDKDDNTLIVIPGYEDDYDVVTHFSDLRVKKKKYLVPYLGDWNETEDKRSNKAILFSCFE